MRLPRKGGPRKQSTRPLKREIVIGTRRRTGHRTDGRTVGRSLVTGRPCNKLLRMCLNERVGLIIFKMLATTSISLPVATPRICIYHCHVCIYHTIPFSWLCCVQDIIYSSKFYAVFGRLIARATEGLRLRLAVGKSQMS